LRPGPLLALACLLAVAFAACKSDSVTLSGQEILSTIPWRAPEQARYRLLDGGEVQGSGVLVIESQDGEFSFRQEFESEEFRDKTVAVADGGTLQPKSVQRVIEGPDGERSWEVTYEGGIATVVQRSQDDERRDEVTVPTRSYDSWTDVFLWRTIDFRAGYEATYVDVLSATLAKPGVISQKLRVTGRETIVVPAGTFEAWRLEITSSDGSQTAWYADTPERLLVRYDNGSLVFELESLE
jgi:hypothetical protein